MPGYGVAVPPYTLAASGNLERPAYLIRGDSDSLPAVHAGQQDAEPEWQRVFDRSPIQQGAENDEQVMHKPARAKSKLLRPPTRSPPQPAGNLLLIRATRAPGRRARGNPPMLCGLASRAALLGRDRYLPATELMACRVGAIRQPDYVILEFGLYRASYCGGEECRLFKSWMPLVRAALNDP